MNQSAVSAVAVPAAPELAVKPQSLTGQIETFLGITVPFCGLVAAGVLLWGWGFSWVDLGLLIGMYLLTGLGITVGFHRLFVHRSFETFMPVKFILAVYGSMAAQGNLIKWAGYHRHHHKHSDTTDDIHTPHQSGRGISGYLLGFWHAHLGWAFKPDPPNLGHYVKDLRASRTLRFVSRLFPFWVILGLAIPATLGGIISGTWAGVLTGLLWGGLVRVFLVHHVTASVNSACHLWGSRPFKTTDHSRNNLVFGVLAMGEGWHNSHHAFPTSARHGLRWWEIDVSYWFIRSLAFVGLAWNVKLPTKQAQLRERRPRGELASR